MAQLSLYIRYDFFSGVLPWSGGTNDDMFCDRYVTVRLGWVPGVETSSETNNGNRSQVQVREPTEKGELPKLQTVHLPQMEIFLNKKVFQ